MVVRTLLTIILTLASSLIPVSALAHTDATDSTMTVTLHVAPHDTAIAGQPQILELFYLDATGEFRLADCNCSVVVHSPDGTEVSRSVEYVTPTIGRVPWTFARPGLYTVAIEGQPAGAALFDPFVVEVPIVVAPDPLVIKQTQHRFELGLYGAIGGASALIVLIVGSYLVVNRRRSSQEN